ncbi:MAG: hypothetical protein WBZ36_30055 [Candidatus Nitrosopolaris sp.]
MSKALWACWICGEDFTRRSSAERHSNNLHQGSSGIVRYIEYLAGRASGFYPPPIDPPRLARRGRPQFGKISKRDQEIFTTSSDRTVATDSTTKDFWWEFGKDTKNDQSEMMSHSQLSSNQSDNDMWDTEDEFDKSVQKFLQLKKLMNQFYNHSNPFYMPITYAPMNIPEAVASRGMFSRTYPPPIDLSHEDTILGWKGYVCKKCFSFEFRSISDDVKRISVKSNHTCYPQTLREALFVTDIPGTINKRRQELIYCLTYMVNSIAKQGLVDLTAVEVPANIFDTRLNSYEEYIDLNSLQSVTLDWAYRVAKEGKIMINTTDLQGFLGIFEATLGFFSLTINKVKRYFFVYITNGLAPQNIKYLKLLRESPKTTEIDITTAIDKELKDVSIYEPQTAIPSLRPDKFRSPLQNPTIYELINIPEAFVI